ncbi:MAG: ParB/RepB/Spo0J family partition protein [Clostridia bacterium]|nr:ParB/RepB/Spo0J family partition protein [Clostridia bacterium]
MDMPVWAGAEKRRAEEGRSLTWLDLSAVAPGPFQPRNRFDESGIAELAESIRRYGLLSPLVVRRTAGGGYELIAGERRLRALKKLGRTHADAIVTPAFDLEAALIALAENLEREQLHFFEEAEAYRRLVREHGLNQEELSRRLGKSVPAISNKMRLMQLEEDVRCAIRENGLSERHARELLRLNAHGDRVKALQQAVAGPLSVRALEKLVDRMIEGQKKKPRMKISDERLYINAVLAAVKKLNSAGVAAVSRVVETEDAVEVIVRLPRIGAQGRACG